MSFKNKYIVVKSYYNAVFISLKDIIVNKSIALVKNNDEEAAIREPVTDQTNYDSKIWYLAKFVPDKILNVIYEEQTPSKLSKSDPWYVEGFDEEIAANTGFEIKDGEILHHSYYFSRNREVDGTITTVPKERIDNIDLTGFIDENYNAPFILEFDSDETAQLYMEANKSEWLVED